jgi:hypothetical protein
VQSEQPVVKTRGPALVAAAAIGISLAVVAIVAIPVLLLERAEDWRAYAEAATAIRSGTPLYIWTTYPDIRSFGQHAYLYPPPLAAIWAVGLTPEWFAVLKAVGLAASTWLLARATGAAWWLAMVIAVLAVTSPPAIHDLVLGNVMAIIAAAVALSLARPGWLGSGAFGIVCAIALKPTIGPYVVWLLVRRRDSFVRAFAAGLATTLAFVLLLGPGRYVEYVQALPKTAVLAAPFTGNLGLSAISPLAGLAGIIVAYVLTLAAAIRLDERAAAVVALAMTQLAQPTIGLNYAVLLIPGVILLWAVDRRVAVAMAVGLPIVVIVNPVLAAVLLAGSATIVSIRAGREPAQSTARA